MFLDMTEGRMACHERVSASRHRSTCSEDDAQSSTSDPVETELDRRRPRRCTRSNRTTVRQGRHHRLRGPSHRSRVRAISASTATV